MRRFLSVGLALLVIITMSLIAQQQSAQAGAGGNTFAFSVSWGQFHSTILKDTTTFMRAEPDQTVRGFEYFLNNPFSSPNTMDWSVGSNGISQFWNGDANSIYTPVGFQLLHPGANQSFIGANWRPRNCPTGPDFSIQRSGGAIQLVLANKTHDTLYVYVGQNSFADRLAPNDFMVRTVPDNSYWFADVYASGYVQCSDGWWDFDALDGASSTGSKATPTATTTSISTATATTTATVTLTIASSSTPTSTPTASATLTLTNTQTATPINTSTPTNTTTSTVTQTPTSLPTATTTRIPTASPTSSATPRACQTFIRKDC
jgi:hypothetical protein